MQMNKTSFIKMLCITLLLFSVKAAGVTRHPNLIINQKDIQVMKQNLGKAPLFDKSFNEAKKAADEALRNDIDVPVPNDPGGGYTHERHKRNYNEMYLAGIVYNVTGEKKYASFIRTMLLKYAGLIPSLKKHPYPSSSSPGRLFYQSLNETVWIFYTIQAYDCIYDFLSKEDRNTIETKVFRPMVDYFMNEHLDEFDRIHNHGTWMTASVGLVGYALNDKDMVEKALHGSTKKDTGGFLAQINNLFSPDGYYVEGAYYARYALMPFFLFSQAIENNQPEVKIFSYRDQILKKALYSALQLSYTNGAFIPINDALKEKNYLSVEIVYALDIVYKYYGRDNNLLGIAQKQNQVMLSEAGVDVALGLKSVKTAPDFSWQSINYSDGPDGSKGGVSLLRSGSPDDQECLLFKYTSHGMEHGHYDKLGILFYDQGTEILQDYGSSRFINVEQKTGGRYLPENFSFAKTTVAHNSLVVDGKSNYNGNIKIAEKYSPKGFAFSSADPELQYSSAVDEHSYDGVKMHRTVAMVKDKNLSKPVVIDVISAFSKEEHQYDLPYYYLGQFIAANFQYEPSMTSLVPLGSENGYQHLWVEAKGKTDGNAVITWLNNSRYYSITTDAGKSAELYLTRIGANDPKFNLRREPGYLIRQRSKDHTFASVIEPHGKFDPRNETSENSSSQISSVKVLETSGDYTAVEVKGKPGFVWTLIISENDPGAKTKHTYKLGSREISWTGPVYLQK